MFDRAKSFFYRIYKSVLARWSPSPSDDEISRAIQKVLEQTQSQPETFDATSKVCIVTFNDGRRDVCAPQIRNQQDCDLFRVSIGGAGCSIQNGPCSSGSRVGYAKK